MKLTLGTNISALRAQRLLDANTQRAESVSQKMAGGLRIQRAADDPAGLAVSSSLKADTRIYTQAIRNLNDATNLLNVADSALAELSNVVTRQEELAAQAANGTYSSHQRTALHQEAAALTDEYNRIVASTKYNGISLLSNPQGFIGIQAGYGDEGVLGLNLGSSLTLAKANGTFQNQVTFSTGTVPVSVVSADLNGDSLMDLLVSDRSDNRIGVLLGNGDGTFKARTSYRTYFNPQQASLGDFNEDGFIDIVAPDYGSSAATILFGNGDGSFKGRQSFTTGSTPQYTDVADFNNDGNLDFLTSDYSSTISIFQGNGNGTFAARVSFSTGSGPRQAKILDLNNDGKLDVVVAEELSDQVAVLYGNGDGSFKARVSIGWAGDGPFSLATGDFDGNGTTDIATIGRYSAGVTLHLNNGDGTFGRRLTASNVTNSAWLQSSDLTGDGKADILAVSAAGAKLLSGNGDGTFKAAVSLATGTDPFHFTIADVDGDKVDDIITANQGSNSISVLLASPDTTSFASHINLASATGARAAISDLRERRDNLLGERGAIGALQARISTASRNLSVSRDNLAAASSRITDADMAEEAAHLVSAKIASQVGAQVLAHSFKSTELVLTLLS